MGLLSEDMIAYIEDAEQDRHAEFCCGLSWLDCEAARHLMGKELLRRIEERTGVSVK